MASVTIQPRDVQEWRVARHTSNFGMDLEPWYSVVGIGEYHSTEVTMFLSPQQMLALYDALAPHAERERAAVNEEAPEFAPGGFPEGVEA